MTQCGDNRGIWRSILKYSVIVQHNRLVLETMNKKKNDRFIF